LKEYFTDGNNSLSVGNNFALSKSLIACISNSGSEE
jgi:hypothetical protein